jgi:hypothetical protein
VKDLIAVACQLSCDVNTRAKKPDAIDQIERAVLGVKEMAVSGVS